MRKYIYPLNKVDFFKVHKNAWENGWTYGPGFDELYLDYLVNWVYFVDYLDVLIKSINASHSRLYSRSDNDIVTIPFVNGEITKIQVVDCYVSFFDQQNKPDSEVIQNKPDPDEITLKFLIGEAPPFWAGKSKQINRTYYYNPNHTGSTNYLSVPYNHFILKKYRKERKYEKLIDLAKKHVILIDVFPFPIWQKSEIRSTITDNFSCHIRNYFVSFFNDLYNYLKAKPENYTFRNEFAFIAPEFTSIQFMYGSKTQNILHSCFSEFGDVLPLSLSKKIVVSRISGTKFSLSLSKGQVVPKTKGFSEKAKFLYNLIYENPLPVGTPYFNVPSTDLEKLPILISEGNISFKTIFNCKKRLKKKI